MLTQSISRRNIRFRIGLGLALIGGAASLYAFRLVFARPGEDALRLLPSNCLVVASADLSPGPDQVLTFEQIEQALKRNGVKGPIQQSFFDLIEHSPAAEPIRELTTRSFAFGLIAEDEKAKNVDMVLLMPLTDGPEADHVLHNKGVAEFWKGTPFFKLPHSQANMMVVGNTLVISDKPNGMHEVGMVASGRESAITGSADFLQARSQQPGDANLMVFASPKIFSLESLPAGTPKMTGWTSLGASIRDGGLAFTFQSHGDPTDEMFRTIGSIKPLRADLTRILPPGAYAVTAMSQVGKYAKPFEDGFDRAVAKKSNSLRQTISKATNMDLDTDVEPGLEGDSVLAAYPSDSGPAGIDLLLVVDDQNGANPSTLADKFQSFVDQEAKKSKSDSDWMTTVNRGGMVENRLSDKVEKELRTQHPDAKDPIRYKTLFGNKTVAWAKVNGAVMIATSEDLLNPAAEAYGGKGSALSSDAALSKAADSADGSQSLAVFDFSRIAEGVKNTGDESKMDSKSRALFDQAIGAFSGLKQPLEVRGKVTVDGSQSGKLFIPMDYSKLIDFIGSATKH